MFLRDLQPGLGPVPRLGLLAEDSGFLPQCQQRLWADWDPCHPGTCEDTCCNTDTTHSDQKTPTGPCEFLCMLSVPLHLPQFVYYDLIPVVCQVEFPAFSPWTLRPVTAEGLWVWTGNADGGHASFLMHPIMLLVCSECLTSLSDLQIKIPYLLEAHFHRGTN